MIMEAVKNGDLQQAALLFDQYHKRIFNFLARMTMDRDVAEDLTQNVFLRMIRYRSSYREGARFQAWIYQMARNGFSDHYQENKKKYSNHVNMEKIGDRIADKSDSEEQDHREQLLHRSMAMLDEDPRELLVLKRLE